MAGDPKKLQPIIVVATSAAGTVPHGGAWKIAYADFVTAMMAFFLLMWLLGSTTEGDRMGIADYSAAAEGGAAQPGTVSGDSSSLVRGGTDLTRTRPGQTGRLEAKRSTINLQALKERRSCAERARLQALQAKVRESLAGNPRLAALQSQIKIDMTADGLRIQIVDEQNRPMFDSGSAALRPHMRELLHEIAQILTEVPNRLTLEGHTDAAPFSGGERGYSNWSCRATAPTRVAARTARRRPA